MQRVFQSGIFGEELCILKALSEQFAQAIGKFSSWFQTLFRAGLYQRFDLILYESIYLYSSFLTTSEIVDLKFVGHRACMGEGTWVSFTVSLWPFQLGHVKFDANWHAEPHCIHRYFILYQLPRDVNVGAASHETQFWGAAMLQGCNGTLLLSTSPYRPSQNNMQCFLICASVVIVRFSSVHSAAELYTDEKQHWRVAELRSLTAVWKTLGGFATRTVQDDFDV